MANLLEQLLNPDDPADQTSAEGRPRVFITGTPTNKLDVKMQEGAGGQADTGNGVDIGALLSKLGGMIGNLGTAGVNPGEAPIAERVRDRLLGVNGVERAQTWPEKLIRSGATLPGDVMSGAQPMPLPGTRAESTSELPENPTVLKTIQTRAGPMQVRVPAGGMLRTSPWQQPADRVIERAQDTSGLMGGGSIAGTNAAEATLGSGPILRPAVKYNGKIIKGDVGQDHLELSFPKAIQEEAAAKGLEDIRELPGMETGFVNHKGQFLDHNKAGNYAIDNGLIPEKYTKYHGEDYIRNGGLTSDMLFSDTGTSGAPISAIAKQQAPAFYSAVEHSVMNAPQPKMGYDQWMGYLKNQPGVKGEELAWMGLGENNPFEGKSVSKEQMQDWVNNHKVEIKEIEKGSGPPLDKYELDEVAGDYVHHAVDDFQHTHGRQPSDAELEGMRREIREDIAASPEDYGVDTGGGTKFGQYQLPGGENYREMLFTLPVKAKGPSPELLARKAESDAKLDQTIAMLKEKYKPQRGEVLAGIQDRMSPEDRQLYIDINRDRGAIESEMAEATGRGTIGDAAAGNYRSSHWDEPNVLAHTRLNDRVIDGKKSLHVEEIQSDWHQEGRKKGYETERKEAMTKVQDLIKEASTLSTKDPRYQEIYAELPKWQTKANERSVPDAPFKTTWPDLVLKRLIREASEKGYDQISWTPGEAQAARYDLSKTIDTLSWDPKSGTLKGFKGNDNILTKKATADQLPDMVGKEAAEKLLKSELRPVGLKETPHHVLEGEELKVGGEGMKAFYDKMLVDKANALGKKFGAKVGTAEIESPQGSAMDNWPKKLPNKKHPVYVLPITDKLRDAAIGKGFPLFTSGIPFPLQPVDGNPWKDKQK